LNTNGKEIRYPDLSVLQFGQCDKEKTSWVRGYVLPYALEIACSLFPKKFLLFRLWKRMES
jgi:hypothetical protein